MYKIVRSLTLKLLYFNTLTSFRRFNRVFSRIKHTHEASGIHLCTQVSSLFLCMFEQRRSYVSEVYKFLVGIVSYNNQNC